MFKKPYAWDEAIDYSLIFPVLCLLLIGIVSIYIAVSHDYPHLLQSMMIQQVAWIGLGIFLAFVVMFFQTEFLYRLTPFLYLLGLVLMGLPLYFYSPDLVASTGAKNWVTIGGTTLFQPSEFMKLSYILILSRLIVSFYRRHKRLERRISLDFLLLIYMFLLTLPVLVLLYFQKDLGTALVFLAIFSGLVLVSGVSWKIILPTWGGLTALISSFLLIFISKGGRTFFHNLGMPTYQINRILAWLHPFEYAKSTTFQQAQGQIAIGSGGLWGQGFNVSNLLIPVRESDMIFTVIAEDFGFLGSACLIGLYLLLIYRMIRVTLQSNNQFYSYLSTGFIMMLLFHIFENIGAVTGLLPLTGIPLPFISQGGSSIVSNLIGVGLILSISYQNKMAQVKARPARKVEKRIVLQDIR